MKMDIVLQTDFGGDSGYAASMYGTMKLADRELKIYDLTHEIRPFDIRQASGLLRRTIPFWPAETVFVSVVDPGVGTDRRACAVRLKNGSYVVTPDNGTLTEIFDFIDEVRQIDASKNRLSADILSQPCEQRRPLTGKNKSQGRACEKETNGTPRRESDPSLTQSGGERLFSGGSTFDGRDLFAWCAARLAAGIIDFSEEGVGPEYRKEEILRYVKNPPKLTEGFVECEIADVERRFGGAALSVSAKQLSSAGLSPGDLLHVSVRKGGTLLYEGKMRYGISFGSVKPGEPVLYDGSAEGAACISLNRDHFAERCLPSLCRRGEEFSDYKVSIRRMTE